MKPQAAPLSGDERLKIASFLGTAVTAARRREEIANPCARRRSLKGGGTAWASWGGGPDEYALPVRQRRRDSGGRSAALEAQVGVRVSRYLDHAFPARRLSRRVFVGGQDGSVFALDAATGCVHWSTTVQSQVRSGITVGEIGGNPAVFFGDSAGFVYALDGATGKQLWKMRPDEHPASTVTATPVFYQGRLYVGSASREEALSVAAAYPCCTFRGSETALDAATGKVIWKRYMIPEAAKERPKGRWPPRGAVGSGACGPLPRSIRNTTRCT